MWNIFPSQFPSAPPGSYFNSGNNLAWVHHHQQLKDFFSTFPCLPIPRKDQLWRDSQRNLLFVYLPGRLPVRSLDCYFFPKLRPAPYHSRRHTAGTPKATHHGYHRVMSEKIPKWALFHETCLDFLQSIKSLLLFVEETLIRTLKPEWDIMKKNVPPGFGLFGTVWTTAVHNPSYSEWHYDPGDLGVAALLYFGDFSGGELELGYPVSKTIPVSNFDLVFLKSSRIYHRSQTFQGNRVNLIFYCSTIKNEQLIPEPKLK